MVATAVASYFLLTADYGPQPNAVEPVSHYFFFIPFRSCFVFVVS
jgi:hypothetical protein